MDLDLIAGKKPNKRVLLYSGGMDSYIIHKLEDFDTVLYIDSNSKYSKIERSFLESQDIKNLVIDDRLDLGNIEFESAIVPLRNLFFTMIGSFYGDEIVLGATSGDRSFDKDINFSDKSSDLLSYIYGESWWCDQRNINVNLKYKSWTKKQLIDEYVKRGFDVNDLVTKSFSCYNPVNECACGKCKPCVRKWISLLPYKNTSEYFDFNPEHYWAENIEKIKANIGDKILSRGDEDRETIEIWDNYIKGKA